MIKLVIIGLALQNTYLNYYSDEIMKLITLKNTHSHNKHKHTLI